MIPSFIGQPKEGERPALVFDSNHLVNHFDEACEENKIPFILHLDSLSLHKTESLRLCLNAEWKKKKEKIVAMTY
jgi:hypothetical protein